MGLLDALLGGRKESAGGGGGDMSALIQAVLAMLAGGGQGQGQAGGLQALIRMFQSKGLGDLISSWIGTGRNLPVSAEQLKNGLGPDLLGQLASRAGMAPDDAASSLSSLLPELIDKLTPKGNAPNAGLLQAVLAMLAGGGQGQGGGLGALLQAFQGKGMEDLLSSWIGTGQNLPVDADQLKNGLGPDLLGQLASRAGVAPDDAASGLSELLPGLIDQLTPGGKVPDFDRLTRDMGSLDRFFKG